MENDFNFGNITPNPPTQEKPKYNFPLMIFIFGIISLAGFVFVFISFLFSIIGISFFANYRRLEGKVTDGFAISGFVCSIIALIVSVCGIIRVVIEFIKNLLQLLS